MNPTRHAEQRKLERDISDEEIQQAKRSGRDISDEEIQQAKRSGRDISNEEIQQAKRSGRMLIALHFGADGERSQAEENIRTWGERGSRRPFQSCRSAARSTKVGAGTLALNWSWSKAQPEPENSNIGSRIRGTSRRLPIA